MTTCCCLAYCLNLGIKSFTFKISCFSCLIRQKLTICCSEDRLWADYVKVRWPSPKAKVVYKLKIKIAWVSLCNNMDTFCKCLKIQIFPPFSHFKTVTCVFSFDLWHIWNFHSTKLWLTAFLNITRSGNSIWVVWHPASVVSNRKWVAFDLATQLVSIKLKWSLRTPNICRKIKVY